MVEYRPIDPADYPEYQRFLRYAFAAEHGPLSEEDGQEVDTSLFADRGVYDDGTLKSVCKRYEFEAFVRDGTETVGGVGAVATPPEYRRQGTVRKLLAELCREYHEDGVGLAVLWPFSTPFYRNLGWATANDRYRVEYPPSELPAHDQRGAFRPQTVDDWERFSRVEGECNEGVTLSMRRSETWWRERTLTSWTGGSDPYLYGYERDGELAGYLMYDVRDGDGDHERTLSVDGFGYVDEEAHRALLEYLRRHGAQIDHVIVKRAPWTRPLALAENPDAVTCERQAGAMVRLTGVEYLEELDWSPLAESMTLTIEDPLLPENGGVFRVSPEGRIDEVGGGASLPVDAEIDIGTLSQLVVGRYDPASAERLAGLTLETESLRRPLSEIFPERRVCLQEFF